MIQNEVDFAIAGWFGIAGGIEAQSDWSEWSNNQLSLLPVLPRPNLKLIPKAMVRRLDTLGRCVMSASERCLPLIVSEPAVICVSRHGDVPAMDKLIQCARDHEDISPTAFAYSVHNRFSSLISMFADYRGVNGAYGSVSDGFPLALAEATALISEHPSLQVMVLAYESDLPEAYDDIVSRRWSPHVAAFVVQRTTGEEEIISLVQHSGDHADGSQDGSCLPFIRALMEKKSYRDGRWEYRYGRK